jgi:hypothetical protein
VADAEQRGDRNVRRVWVSTPLRASIRITASIGGRGAGDHVAGILLVAGRVGDDELALVGGEEAVGDVDGDALLALGGEAVDQQAKSISPPRADLLAVASSAASWSSKIILES